MAGTPEGSLALMGLRAGTAAEPSAEVLEMLVLLYRLYPPPELAGSGAFPVCISQEVAETRGTPAKPNWWRANASPSIQNNVDLFFEISYLNLFPSIACVRKRCYKLTQQNNLPRSKRGEGAGAAVVSGGLGPPEALVPAEQGTRDRHRSDPPGAGASALLAARDAHQT